jgi:hypothetical protein
MPHLVRARHSVVLLLLSACGREPFTAPDTAPPADLSVVSAGMRTADDFGTTGLLGTGWFTARPAYVIEAGQVSTQSGQSGTTPAVWRRDAFPADQFSEVAVGDLAGRSFDTFRGLQVFVRLASLTGNDRIAFHYASAEGRYEIKYETTPGTVLAQSGPAPAPVRGDILRLEAAGDLYIGRVNGREVLRARGPLLAGRFPGFAVGIDQGSLENPRRVVDVWSGGATVASRALVPLSELESFTYQGFRGGLYSDGKTLMPARHDSVGRARARRVVPRDRNGAPSATGRYVLLSIGMSSTSMEWCAAVPGPCTSRSFTGQARADASVNRSTLAIVNGAMGGQTAATWDQPTDLNYNRVRDFVLTPQGLSERQVQVIWLKVANPYPVTPLPGAASDADLLVRQMADIVRAARVRYPNLQLVFISSRIYGGYATIRLNPEPFAFESGLAVKWVVGAQIAQMDGGQPDPRAGDLNYDRSAPWIGWGPYLWANGTTPRRDGLVWQRSDFIVDGTHPSAQGEQKVGRLLLNFFKTDARASCWFLAGGRC